jgi:hypothetical protein
MAWFHSPGLCVKSRLSALAWSWAGVGFSQAISRLMTRRTLPSTAATGSPKAIEATAAAV